jgi:hypothetical protein
MYRRELLRVSMAAALMLVPAGAMAQQKSVKEMLPGAWTQILIDGVQADGTHVPLFGPNPLASLIMTGNGKFSVQLLRTVNRPKFASKNRSTGTADENKAAVLGALAYFGTYTVDDAGKTVTLRIEGSTFPNQEGTMQKWQITALTDDVLTISVPVADTSNPNAGFPVIEVVSRKAK